MEQSEAATGGDALRRARGNHFNLYHFLSAAEGGFSILTVAALQMTDILAISQLLFILGAVD